MCSRHSCCCIATDKNQNKQTVQLFSYLYCLPWCRRGWLTATRRRASVSNSPLSNSRPRTEARAGVVLGNQKRGWNSNTRQTLRMRLWCGTNNAHLVMKMSHNTNITQPIPGTLAVSMPGERNIGVFEAFLAFHVTLTLHQDLQSSQLFSWCQDCLVSAQHRAQTRR